jgi:hypothetical protein
VLLKMTSVQAIEIKSKQQLKNYGVVNFLFSRHFPLKHILTLVEQGL